MCAVLFLLSSLFFLFLSFYCFFPSLVFVFACFTPLFFLFESFFLCQIFQNAAVVWRWFIIYHNSLRALLWLCTSVGMFVSFYMSVSVHFSLTPSCSLYVFSVSTRNITEAAPRPLIMTNRRWQAKDEEKGWREKRREEAFLYNTHNSSLQTRVHQRKEMRDGKVKEIKWIEGCNLGGGFGIER